MDISSMPPLVGLIIAFWLVGIFAIIVMREDVVKKRRAREHWLYMNYDVEIGTGTFYGTFNEYKESVANGERNI